MGQEMSTQDTSLPEMIDIDHPEIMDTDSLLGGGEFYYGRYFNVGKAL